MRAIPETFDPDVVAAIDQRLAAVRADELVSIPLAIESGSRAWGFPSPDSDYDCRFVYVRRESDYLSPWLHRDVIETPLDAVLDVGGWDLRKAVQLLVKGNAVVCEWLRSPVAYDVDPIFRDALLTVADDVVDRHAIGRHYTHVAMQQWGRYGGTDEIKLKRVFYALRPALALRWLETHPEARVPPMNLGVLVAETGLDPDLVAAVADLVARKAVTKELGTGVPSPLIVGLVDREVARGLVVYDQSPSEPEAARRDAAADFFRWAVRRFAPPDPTPPDPTLER